MKKINLLIAALFLLSMVQAQVQTISNPNANPTITPEQIKAMGEASQQNANREVIILDFEGIANEALIGNYYNGGAGPNYGIYFGGNARGIIDEDAGGSGNIANEPSPSTVMFYLTGGAATMNLPAGFTTGFSFYYSSDHAITIFVYDGVDGTGNLLTQQSFPINHTLNCTGDPNGVYCNWDPVGVAFAGTAKSVYFDGVADYCGFDDVTFGAITPGPSEVPISDWALFIGIGLILIAAIVRFKRIF